MLDLGQPSDNTVTAAKLATTSITGQTAETSAADADTIIIHDDSASALRKMTRSNFVSGVGGDNTPSFFAISTSTEDNNDVSDDTFTKKTFSTEVYDSDSTYSSSRFTPGVAGKYMITAKLSVFNTTNNSQPYMWIYKNGSQMDDPYFSQFRDGDSANASFFTFTLNAIVDADNDDYYEIYFRKNDGGNTGGSYDGYFGAFRIIL